MCDLIKIYLLNVYFVKGRVGDVKGLLFREVNINIENYFIMEGSVCRVLLVI